MPRPFKRINDPHNEGEHDRRFGRPELGFNSMFETRSDAWEAVGLALESNERTVKRAQKQSIATGIAIVVVLILFGFRTQVLPHTTHKGISVLNSPWDTITTVAAVIAFSALGVNLARAIGKAMGPTLMKRMEPGVAGTVGFVIRLVTMGLTILIALHLAGVNTQSLAIGASFTAVIFGLAAQQTLGNLIAGLVLLSARPFKVGERVRLQSGSIGIGGFTEGIVSSLGLMYTTLARGEDRIMIPNNAVLAAAIVPLREPKAVDIKVRLGSHVKPSELQDMLDSRITTPMRGGQTSVVVEEMDGEDLVVRVQATPESSGDGAKLTDEVIGVLSVIAGRDGIQVGDQVESD